MESIFNFKGEAAVMTPFDFYWCKRDLNVIADGILPTSGTRIHFVSELGYRGHVMSNSIIFSGYWSECGTLRKQPYRENTPLEEIIKDGWCREFEIKQTLEEAIYMGYDTTLEEIQKGWDTINIETRQYFGEPL